MAMKPMQSKQESLIYDLVLAQQKGGQNQRGSSGDVPGN